MEEHRVELLGKESALKEDARLASENIDVNEAAHVRLARGGLEGAGAPLPKDRDELTGYCAVADSERSGQVHKRLPVEHYRVARPRGRRMRRKCPAREPERRETGMLGKQRTDFQGSSRWECNKLFACVSHLHYTSTAQLGSRKGLSSSFTMGPYSQCLRGAMNHA